MWPDSPEQKYTYITQRQAELRAEAATNRAARASAAGPHAHRIKGVHFHVGTLLIIVGRRLCDEDGRYLDPAH
jgi:hypothetical protein